MDQEVIMGEKFDKFCSDLRTKIDDADKHLKGLQASAKNAGQKARDDAKAHLATLENKAKEQQAKIEESEAKVKAWAQQKKAITADKIAEWKAQRQVKKLNDRADDAESYAVATMQVASAAIDEAERAAIEAVVARIDADAVQSTPASNAS
jgi:DNA repair exonuclease SbcCD ATPase subunit